MAMISSADLKLGLRMLRKYPGLTFAGGLALAIAIGLGAGWYDFSQDLLHPRLPLPGGDRIVDIDMRDSMTFRGERRILHDFVAWRRDARFDRACWARRGQSSGSLTRDRVRVDSVLTAEITASAFRIARVPPLLGRTLLDADEQARRTRRSSSSATRSGSGGSADAPRPLAQTVVLGTTTPQPWWASCRRASPSR